MSTFLTVMKLDTKLKGQQRGGIERLKSATVLRQLEPVALSYPHPLCDSATGGRRGQDAIGNDCAAVGEGGGSY
jgi:hypothetical protein